MQICSLPYNMSAGSEIWNSLMSKNKNKSNLDKQEREQTILICNKS